MVATLPRVKPPIVFDPLLTGSFPRPSDLASPTGSRFNPVHDAKTGRFGSRAGASGQAALDAVPAKLTRAPEGHYGHYEGEALSGPPGMGSVRALSEYEGTEYGTVNNYLRHPETRYGDDEIGRELNAHADRMVTEIDKTMAVSKAQTDLQVGRVIQRGSAVFGQDVWYGYGSVVNTKDMEHGWDRWDAGQRPDLTGTKWTERAYSSTSADPKVPPSFGARWARDAPDSGEGEPVIMHMHVPAGTGVVQLSTMGHAAEILLERDLTYTVTKDRGVGKDGFRHFDVDVSHG